MKRLVALSATLALVTLAGSACGGGGGGGGSSGTPTPSGTQPPGGSWDPLKVNNSWTYAVTDTTAGNSTKTVVVADISAIGGGHSGTGFRLHTTDVTGFQDEWHTDQGSVELRLHKISYDPSNAVTTDATYSPSKLYVDETAEHTALNATWTEVYTDSTTKASTGQTTQTTHTITWTTQAVNEQVVTPAGTFNCLKVHRVSNVAASAGADKTYWFAQGVGKVKEQDNQNGTPIHTETLTAYTVN